MKYSVIFFHTCLLVAMLVSVNGHWKTKGTGKCRVQSESKTGKQPSWEWVDCTYSGGDLIIISTTKRPTTTQKPLTINGQFKNRGPGKCLVQSETEKTKKGNQPAWVWVDCDYTSGRPKPITIKPPAMKTTVMPTTVRPSPIRPSPIRPSPIRPAVPAPPRPAVPAPPQPAVPERPSVQYPVQRPIQTQIAVRLPMQVPLQVRPPAPVYYSALPAVAVPVPSRRPVPAPFPGRPPVSAPLPSRPPVRAPITARPPMSAPITPRPTAVATTRQTPPRSTTPRNEVCKGRWCWDGKIWVDKGSSSTEKTLNIFKKPPLP